MNKLCQFVTASVAAASMLVGGQAYSHGMWFTERSSQLAVIYGVGADDLDTVKRFDKITSITGYDSDWNEVDAQLIKAGPMVLVGGDDYPDAVSAVMNNGIWAKTKDGKWHAKGRDEVPAAVTAHIHAAVRWGCAATAALHPLNLLTVLAFSRLAAKLGGQARHGLGGE